MILRLRKIKCSMNLRKPLWVGRPFPRQMRDWEEITLRCNCAESENKQFIDRDIKPLAAIH
jgi:hypothetical protein